MDKVVVYLRVSTKGQGDRHGLDAQKAIIKDYADRNSVSVLAEFCEVESGANRTRPVLKQALTHCELTGCKLLTPRLDRLARDLSFLTDILDSGVEVIICDFPNASRFVLHILGSVAEYELMRIRERTKNGLLAAKAKGVVLGKTAAQNRDAGKFAEGRGLGTVENKKRAKVFAAKIKPTIDRLTANGVTSYSDLAVELNAANILTARGLSGRWSAQSVKNLMARIG
jgi:DNA invertase Pin-like site-specific DNA recombinase